MAWSETISPSFGARHEERDADDVVEVLELLEGTRERLAEVLPPVEGEITVIVHGSAAALALARPVLPVARRLTAPAARRYMVGWPGRRELHVLAPRVLRARASDVPGSREMALLAPAALLAQLVAGNANPRLPPPYTPGWLRRAPRWAWLAWGAGQWFSGQTPHARPAIARRLREGGTPSFPPGLRDAALLGGSVLDLLAREEGEAAVVTVVSGPAAGEARARCCATRSRVRCTARRTRGARTSSGWRSLRARLRQELGAEPGDERPPRCMPPRRRSAPARACRRPRTRAGACRPAAGPRARPRRPRRAP